MSDLNFDALAELLNRPKLRRLLETLNGNGEETRIVGGAVRNALFGREVLEVDCATTALPDMTMERAKAAGFKPVPTGIDHGTITVVVEGEPFEVTTLREDVDTNGRHAVVRFGRDFKADAHRRDFTINALSLDLDGRLHDLTDGVADLEARRVRFIGDAQTRIREDFLRILRFFRFHSEYAHGSPDAEAMRAAGLERAGLATLSRERVRAELLKLLVTRRADEMIRVLLDHGFLVSLLGGVVELGRFSRVQSTDAVERLAALAIMTSEDVDRLRDILRLSNAEYDRLMDYSDLLAVLKARSRPIDRLWMRRLVAEHNVQVVSLVLKATNGEPSPVVVPDAVQLLHDFESGKEPLPVFPLRGADLIAAGLPKGPQVGEVLNKARQSWLAEGCRLDADYARELMGRILQNV